MVVEKTGDLLRDNFHGLIFQLKFTEFGKYDQNLLERLKILQRIYKHVKVFLSLIASLSALLKIFWVGLRVSLKISFSALMPASLLYCSMRKIKFLPTFDLFKYLFFSFFRIFLTTYSDRSDHSVVTLLPRLGHSWKTWWYGGRETNRKWVAICSYGRWSDWINSVFDSYCYHIFNHCPSSSIHCRLGLT